MKKTRILVLLLTLLLTLSCLTLPLLAAAEPAAEDPSATASADASADASGDAQDTAEQESSQEVIVSADPSFTVAAKAALLIDLNTGRTVYEQDADERVYPASLTKIMTCLLALENGNLSDVITVDESALSGLNQDSSVVGLKVGEQITLENLLYCMMVSSGNDAANVVAEYIAGSVADFVRMMNERAAPSAARTRTSTIPMVCTTRATTPPRVTWQLSRRRRSKAKTSGKSSILPSMSSPPAQLARNTSSRPPIC